MSETARRGYAGDMMTKTLVATDKYIDPLWQDWSRQTAYAESLPVGSDAEIQAWAKADELYAKWQTAVHAAARLDDHYEAVMAFPWPETIRDYDDLRQTRDAAAHPTNGPREEELAQYRVARNLRQEIARRGRTRTSGTVTHQPRRQYKDGEAF